MQRKLQKLNLELDAPSLDYFLEFLSVYEGKDKLIAILKLGLITEGCTGEAIKHLSASIEVPQENTFSKQVQYYVLTDDKQKWWKQAKKFTSISNLNEIENQIKNLRQLYHNVSPSPTRNIQFGC